MFGSLSQPRAALVGAGAAVALLIASLMAFTGSALAVGNYGPDTCLEGYVWRDAFPGDHVCVTGATRAQAASDNSQAAARRSPTGGAYGPDTCIFGFVWRQAIPSDHVCVTGAIRSQTWADNAQAAARRDSLHLWFTVYGVSVGGQSCSGDVCSVTEPSGYLAYSLHADHVNVGNVVVQLRRLSNGALVRSWITHAGPAGYTPGGRLDLNTGAIDCGRLADSYFRILDPSSGRWSAALRVSSNCAVL